jgi:hypothetical protein
VTVLDRLVVGDYAHPTLTRADDGTVYVGLRYAHPKADPRPPAPPLYAYRPPDYARTEWPAPVENEGINALVADPARQRLYGLTTPGGHFFVTDLAARQTKDLGVVALAPDFYPDLLIASALALDADGNVYTSGAGPHPRTKQNTNGCLLRYGAATGELTRTASWLPAVPGRERFAAVEVFVRGPDGRLYGGTTDGYLFGLDPATLAVTNFGKPLRQAHVVGLACGPDGILYGVGGEPEGLARTFAYDLATHGFTLGPSPSGPMAGEVQSFGTIGAVALDGRGRLVCAERERKGYLVVFE